LLFYIIYLACSLENEFNFVNCIELNFFREGYVVIKVFVLHDPSLPLASYQDRINQIATLTAGFPNILPFQRSLLTDRAGLLIRQYVHDNLYDRIRLDFISFYNFHLYFCYQ